MSPHRPGSGAPTDSAGVPWHGRDLAPHPFAGDDGSADPALAGVLDAAAEGGASVADVVRALAAARVLVPVSAAIGDGNPLPDHVRGDLGAEAAVAIVAGPDGRHALPVFTSTDTMARWDPAARPIPVESSRAALSAVDRAIPKGCSRFLIERPAPGHCAACQPR